MSISKPVQKIAVMLGLCILLFAGSGCVYRIGVQQGNLLDHEDLQQLEVGMTKKQVRFLLGTPLIADPFHKDRWDYLFYYKTGRSEPKQDRWVTVHFENNVVAVIDFGYEPPTDAPAETEISDES